MDHREQMQKEAQQWQATSVKIIQGVRYGVLVLACVGLLILLLQNVGFPKQIDEHLATYIITEEGILFRNMGVNIQGEITNYPLKPNKFGMDDQVVIYANGKRLVQIFYKQGGEYLFAKQGDTVCILGVNRDMILLETDLKNIYPDMESQRCLIYTDLDTFDLPGEYAEYFTMLQK